MGSGLRRIERIDATHLHMTNPFPNSKLREVSDVTLQPPDRWGQVGQLLRGDRKIADFTVAYQVTSQPVGSRVTAVLDLTPKGWLSRLLIAARWGALQREFEGFYDQIAAAAVADARGAPGTPP
jgi:hypothetical protein